MHRIIFQQSVSVLFIVFTYYYTFFKKDYMSICYNYSLFNGSTLSFPIEETPLIDIDAGEPKCLQLTLPCIGSLTRPNTT